MGVFPDYFEAAARHVTWERLPEGAWLARIETVSGRLGHR